MRTVPFLTEVVGALDTLYPPATAAGWDAVGLVCGEPMREVRRVLFAVDAVAATVGEALAAEVQLLIVHHPLFLRPVHGVPATSAKGALIHRLIGGRCGLMVVHTNADVASPGVSDSLAARLGLVDVRPLVPLATDPSLGHGRIGALTEPLTVQGLLRLATAVLPVTAGGIRATGDPERPVRTVAVCGGAGDGFLDAATAAGADAYVTADLRHHRASEHVEAGGPALIDVAHWASERPWLDDAAVRLTAMMVERQGARLDCLVSHVVSDPWTLHAEVATPAAPTAG